MSTYKYAQLVSAWALFGADPLNLARVDPFSLSQQDMMEIFIGDISNKHIICGINDFPKDITEWKGVKVNPSKEVTEIKWWSSFRLQGKFDLKWLPHSVEIFYIGGEKLSGTFDCASVPLLMKIISIDTKLTGDFNLSHLPKDLEELHLNNTFLAESLDLEHLPLPLRDLSLSLNRFTGSVCLTKLPECLIVLSLSYNRLSGSVDLTKLPGGLQHLFLNDNSFSGEADFTQLPQLTFLNVSQTSISGEIYKFNGVYLDVKNSNVRDMRKENTKGD